MIFREGLNDSHELIEDAEISKRAVIEYIISVNMSLDILRGIYSLL